MTAVSTIGLGKRYGSLWALRDCSISVPPGAVCGVVGANGAGKTTLLRLLAGLTRPTTGSATVAGHAPADAATFLGEIGYLAQEVPLYRRWTADDHLAMGAHTNPGWDDGLARERLVGLKIPLDRPIEALSGGMRAQVALALSLGKRPRVLLLDEPVAALDPLARREFLASLAAAVADRDLTVVMSSHLLADLERVCDHLILMAGGTQMLCAPIDELLASHALITAPARALPAIEERHHVVSAECTPRQVVATVRLDGPVLDPAWHVDELGLEDIVLAYLGGRTADTGTLAGVAR
jgi:ABC-2 type transport system ATP-binding protein